MDQKKNLTLGTLRNEDGNTSDNGGLLFTSLSGSLGFCLFLHEAK